MAGHKDVSEPRKVNAQSIILRETAGGYDVLLQLRSMSMKCMPGHLAALGGCRDRTDKDSSETALREVKEECGLITKCVSKGPSKFAEGEKCDWYVIVLRSPAFEAKAKSRSECGDMKSVASLLPSSMQLADCYGHVWLPTSDLENIDPKLPLMGGLLKRIGEAVNFLNPAAKDAVPVPVAKSDRVEEITAAVQKLSLELPDDRWLDLETICSSEDVKALAATGEEILSAVQSSELFEVREDRAIRVIQDA